MPKQTLYADPNTGELYYWPVDREVARRLNLPRYTDLAGCSKCDARTAKHTGPKNRYVEDGSCVGCMCLGLQQMVRDWPAAEPGVRVPTSPAQAAGWGLDWYYGGDRHNGVLCADGPHLRRSHIVTGACLECRERRLEARGPRKAARRAGHRSYTPETPCPDCGQLAERDVVTNRCSGCPRVRRTPTTDGRETETSRMMADCPDLVLGRADARALGLTVYRTGAACLNGHTGWRYVSTGGCIDCLRGRP